MTTFTISSCRFDLDHDRVTAAVSEVLPEPIREHYVVVRGRRYPPKQVLTCVTGLDRADFTTHQARRVLKRLGFVAARATRADHAEARSRADGPHGGHQARALAPHAGKWVALAGPTEILVAANSPHEVLAWLATHEQRAPYGMFRVPRAIGEAEGAAPL